VCSTFTSLGASFQFPVPGPEPPARARGAISQMTDPRRQRMQERRRQSLAAADGWKPSLLYSYCCWYKDSGFGRLVLACGQMWSLITGSSHQMRCLLVQAQQCCMKQRQLDEFRVSRLNMHGVCLFAGPIWVWPTGQAGWKIRHGWSSQLLPSIHPSIHMPWFEDSSHIYRHISK